MKCLKEKSLNRLCRGVLLIPPGHHVLSEALTNLWFVTYLTALPGT